MPCTFAWSVVVVLGTAVLRGLNSCCGSGAGVSCWCYDVGIQENSILLQLPVSELYMEYTGRSFLGAYESV